MKIAFNASFWNQPHTGTGQYTRALLRALLHRDIDNDYCLIAPRNDLTDLPFCVTAHTASTPFSDNLAKLWFEQIAFGSACRAEHIDLAHVPYLAPPLFAPVPRIVTIHDLIPLILPAYRGSLLVRAYTQLVALSARRAAAILADSECSKRDIVQQLRIDPARVHVVYLAASDEYQPATAAQIEAVRRKYTLPEKFVLYLGGFDQRKNVRVIIQAFAQLRDLRAQHFKLVLAGKILGDDSDFFPDPRRLAREANLPADALCLPGHIDEVDKPALYSAARAFVFPSVYEGFGLPPLEAMACGTPVICANAASLPEIVGDAGILVAPADVKAWTDALREVLTNAARPIEMRERGRAQAKKFSWLKCAEEVLRIYESIA